MGLQNRRIPALQSFIQLDIDADANYTMSLLDFPPDTYIVTTLDREVGFTYISSIRSFWEKALVEDYLGKV